MSGRNAIARKRKRLLVIQRREQFNLPFLGTKPTTAQNTLSSPTQSEVDQSPDLAQFSPVLQSSPVEQLSPVVGPSHPAPLLTLVQPTSSSSSAFNNADQGKVRIFTLQSFINIAKQAI